jgi:hypothetical protein
MIAMKKADHDINIAPGAIIGNWHILSIDPSSGKRACCRCVCGSVRILSTAALLDGSALPSCGCQQLSREQQHKLRAEAEEQERRRDRDWRPSRDRT